MVRNTHTPLAGQLEDACCLARFSLHSGKLISCTNNQVACEAWGEAIPKQDFRPTPELLITLEVLIGPGQVFQGCQPTQTILSEHSYQSTFQVISRWISPCFLGIEGAGFLQCFARFPNVE